MKFKINIFFILFSIYLCFIGNFFIFFQYFICVIVHELSHALVAERKGYKLDSIMLMPYGAALKLNDQIYSQKDEIEIAIAGPLSNLIMIVLVVALWWAFPVTYSYTYIFFVANLWTLIFNLLPAYPLDGGRVFMGVLSAKIGRKKSIKIIKIFNITLAVLIFVCFVITCFFIPNFTLLWCSLFLFLGSFENTKNGSYKTMSVVSFFDTEIKTAQDVNCFALGIECNVLDMSRKCKTGKYNIAYIVFPSGKIKVLNQSQIKLLLLKANPTQKIKEFFEQKY